MPRPPAPGGVPMSHTSAGFLVEFRYRVDPVHHDAYLALLAGFRDYVDELGLASFEVFRDDDDPWQVTELHGYDSWSHYQRVDSRGTPAEIERLYEQMDRLVDGGLKTVQSRRMTPWPIPSP